MKKKQILMVVVVVLVIIAGSYFMTQKPAKLCNVNDVVLTSEGFFKDADLPADLKSEDKVNIEIQNDCKKLEIKVGLYREYVTTAERLTTSIKSVQLFIDEKLIDSLTLTIDSERLAATTEIYEFRVNINEFEYEGNKYTSSFDFKMIEDGYELTKFDEILIKQ